MTLPAGRLTPAARVLVATRTLTDPRDAIEIEKMIIDQLSSVRRKKRIKRTKEREIIVCAFAQCTLCKNMYEIKNIYRDKGDLTRVLPRV